MLSLQLRGEYLYTAKGKDGIEIYDVANIDNKAFSERMVSAPVSPLGQRFSVKTRDARWIASPTTLGVDPARRRDPENEEQPIHPLYAYLYVADAQEGLILIKPPHCWMATRATIFSSAPSRSIPMASSTAQVSSSPRATMRISRATGEWSS